MVKHEDLFHASPDLCYRVCSEKQVAADIRYPRFMKRKDPGYLLINIDQQGGIRLDTFSKEKEINTKRISEYGIELTSHQVDLCWVYFKHPYRVE
jgi:hypothetical protein